MTKGYSHYPCKIDLAKWILQVRTPNDGTPMDPFSAPRRFHRMRCFGGFNG